MFYKSPLLAIVLSPTMHSTMNILEKIGRVALLGLLASSASALNGDDLDVRAFDAKDGTLLYESKLSTFVPKQAGNGTKFPITVDYEIGDGPTKLEVCKFFDLRV